MRFLWFAPNENGLPGGTRKAVEINHVLLGCWVSALELDADAADAVMRPRIHTARGVRGGRQTLDGPDPDEPEGSGGRIQAEGLPCGGVEVVSHLGCVPPSDRR